MRFLKADIVHELHLVPLMNGIISRGTIKNAAVGSLGEFVGKGELEVFVLSLRPEVAHSLDLLLPVFVDDLLHLAGQGAVFCDFPGPFREIERFERSAVKKNRGFLFPGETRNRKSKEDKGAEQEDLHPRSLTGSAVTAKHKIPSVSAESH